MSFSYFWVCAWSVNHYTLPIDLYGAGRAAFGGASLVFAYGVMQSLISRPLARSSNGMGLASVFPVRVLPVAGYALSAYVDSATIRFRSEFISHKSKESDSPVLASRPVL